MVQDLKNTHLLRHHNQLSLAHGARAVTKHEARIWHQISVNTFESCVIHLSGMPMVPFIPSMSFPTFCFIICRRIASSRSATPVSQLKQARASTVTLHLLVESVVILLLFRVILLFSRYWHPSAKPSKAAILISIFGHVAYTNQPEFISICNQLR